MDIHNLYIIDNSECSLYHLRNTLIELFPNHNAKLLLHNINDEKKMVPCAAFMNGEYGVNNIYAGVPIIIGKDGVEKIEVIDLDEKEKSEFMNSVDAVKKLWEAASAIDPDLAK